MTKAKELKEFREQLAKEAKQKNENLRLDEALELVGILSNDELEAEQDEKPTTEEILNELTKGE